MTPEALQARLRTVVETPLPVPGRGDTPARHQALFAVAREDVSLAKLAEAHWDAHAILAEAGREPVGGALYGVWASEVPGKAVKMVRADGGYVLEGTKPFCSGIGLVDRALLTVGEPAPLLVDVDLRSHAAHMEANLDIWVTDAFRMTCTGSLTLNAQPVVDEAAVVGEPGWYLHRPGFWHGACGPASCWAGGAAGLLDAAKQSKRRDPHTLAHLGALSSNVWAMEALLERAGTEIDRQPGDCAAAHRRALTLRHSIEQLSTELLQRFARAYGPQPLSMNSDVARRYAETDLFLRQSHGERDLEALGKVLLPSP